MSGLNLVSEEAFGLIFDRGLISKFDDVFGYDEGRYLNKLVVFWHIIANQ